MTDTDVGSESFQLRLFLIRGLMAIAWAAVFAAAHDSLTTVSRSCLCSTR
jgi:hypothetical protein